MDMSSDALAQFDQTVLDMIEYSPSGAVPHTPTHQDGLGRLRASHQVYPSADFKNGYVTVRSLSAKQSFHAGKLEAFLAGAADATELETDAYVFGRYVRSLPPVAQGRAEDHRAAVVGRRLHHRAKHGVEGATEPVHALFLVPGSGVHPGLPGNYLYGSIFQTSVDAVGGGWAIHVHDVENGAAICELANRTEAAAKFQDVLASSPFLLGELSELGFRLN
jgi:hypothetical protein